MTKCIFIDIDGTILPHVGSLTKILENYSAYETPYPLPGVVEKFNEWAYMGYCIIITTARPESMRAMTIDQLSACGLFFDQLIMGIPRGPRVVINDIKPATNEYPELMTAEAVNVKRNSGLHNVNI